ncbi:hypothetical protein BDV29DRAFT_171641 [Aspergillus leporis]|uniref:DUF1690-domain-containing protein n=1 Tax=Aspergillus leporis TaxID=41062 RepID=A0A5N5X4X5_9EURO|nr:hypothetical protein BDV29DRAFT_171641 [Aspergillus leporis]
MTNSHVINTGGSRLRETIICELLLTTLELPRPCCLRCLHGVESELSSSPEKNQILFSSLKDSRKGIKSQIKHIMGAGSSKPDASAGSKHVFSSGGPVQFSSNLVDSLQSNSETDSSRAKSLELQIQARVAQELERLREREQQTLAEIEKRIAESKDNAPSSVSSTPNISYPPGSLNLDAPRIPFAGREYTPAPVADAQPIDRDVSHKSVNSEIEELRAKLEGRRKLVEIDESVEKAKSNVVSCLRLNDRRPLDCWQEVDAFKKEVAKLEEAFVDRVVG